MHNTWKTTAWLHETDVQLNNHAQLMGHELLDSSWCNNIEQNQILILRILFLKLILFCYFWVGQGLSWHRTTVTFALRPILLCEISYRIIAYANRDCHTSDQLLIGWTEVNLNLNLITWSATWCCDQSYERSFPVNYHSPNAWPLTSLRWINNAEYVRWWRYNVAVV